MFVAIIVAGLLFCSAPLRSLGDPPYQTALVYVVNTDGSSTDVTNMCFYIDGQAYLYPDDPIQITLDYEEGHVYDQYGTLIGYIAVPPTNPASEP